MMLGLSDSPLCGGEYCCEPGARPAYSVEECRKSEDDGKPEAPPEVALAEAEAEVGAEAKAEAEDPC